MQARREHNTKVLGLRLGLRVRREASVCLYCRDALERERAECNTCAASYHVDCLEALASCGNVGCEGAPADALRWTEPLLSVEEEQGLHCSSRYRNDTRSLHEFKRAVARIDARLQAAQAEIDRHRCSVCEDWLRGPVAPCGHCGWRAHMDCHEENGGRCACPTASQRVARRSGERRCSICKESRGSGETFCGFCGWCAGANCHRTIHRGHCKCRRVQLPAGPIVSSLRQSDVVYSADAGLFEPLWVVIEALVHAYERFWWFLPLVFFAFLFLAELLQ